MTSIELTRRRLFQATGLVISSSILLACRTPETVDCNKVVKGKRGLVTLSSPQEIAVFANGAVISYAHDKAEITVNTDALQMVFTNLKIPTKTKNSKGELPIIAAGVITPNLASLEKDRADKSNLTPKTLSSANLCVFGPRDVDTITCYINLADTEKQAQDVTGQISRNSERYLNLVSRLIGFSYFANLRNQLNFGGDLSTEQRRIVVDAAPFKVTHLS